MMQHMVQPLHHCFSQEDVTGAWDKIFSAVMESITLCSEIVQRLVCINKHVVLEMEATFRVPTMIYTINLRNASHYDVNDMRYSLSVWASDNAKKLCGKWFFVLPNVRVELSNGLTYNGLVIILDDSVQILWDGRVLRHCTGFCDEEELDGAHAFSIFTTANRNHEGSVFRSIS